MTADAKLKDRIALALERAERRPSQAARYLAEAARLKREREDKMTKTTETAMRPCDHCGAMFRPAKPWQRFHSEQCRVNAFGAKRYKDNGKARRVLRAAVKSLADVETFLEQSLSGDRGFDPAAEALGKVRRVLKAARRVVE